MFLSSHVLSEVDALCDRVGILRRGKLVDLTPFEQVGLVPALPFRADAALLMLSVALLSMLAASWVFERRDLTAA